MIRFIRTLLTGLLCCGIYTCVPRRFRKSNHTVWKKTEVVVDTI